MVHSTFMRQKNLYTVVYVRRIRSTSISTNPGSEIPDNPVGDGNIAHISYEDDALCYVHGGLPVAIWTTSYIQ